MSSHWHYDREGPINDWLELSSGVETSVGFDSLSSTTGPAPAGTLGSVSGAAGRNFLRSEVLAAIREAIISIEFSQLRIWRETVRRLQLNADGLRAFMCSCVRVLLCVVSVNMNTCPRCGGCRHVAWVLGT
jgi:hypothetical protein